MRRYESDKGSKPYDWPAEPSVHEPERGSRLFRGAQEFQVGSSKQDLTSSPYPPHQSRIFSSRTSANNKGNQRVEFFLNRQSRNSQHGPIVGEGIRGMEPIGTGSSEPVQDDSMAALERARELIAATESGYPINPPNPWRMGDSTINDHLDRKKQGPPSIHRAHPLPSPSTLHGHYDSCEGSLPLEHPPHTADLSDKGAPPFKKQDQPPPIDDKDRPLTVRDMELFTKAIQSTIREMSSEFIEALAEMRRSEDIFEESEQE